MSQKLTKEEQLQLEEYKMLNDLLMRESSTFWNRFSILLPVVTFLLTACFYLLKELNDSQAEPTSIIEPWMFLLVTSFCILIGTSTTIIWYFVNEKGAGMIIF